MSAVKQMDDGSMLVVLPEGFPLDDIDAVGAQLEEAGLCVPGFIPAEVGLFSTAGMFYEGALGIPGWRGLVMAEARKLLGR